MTALAHRFADRAEAGRLLAQRLVEMPLADPVILALPRGGVPVGREVANALHAPLDLLLVRRIGAPGQPELALAAVVEGHPPDLVVDEPVQAEVGVSKTWLRDAMRIQLREIERRRQVYLARRPAVAVQGRTVILVDDGIATGTTMRAAVAALRKRHPLRIIVAVPVAPADEAARLRQEVDALVCPMQPSRFGAIGEFYEDFHQLADAEVISCLEHGKAT